METYVRVIGYRLMRQKYAICLSNSHASRIMRLNDNFQGNVKYIICYLCVTVLHEAGILFSGVPVYVCVCLCKNYKKNC